MVRLLNDVRSNYSDYDYKKRFFTADKDIIQTTTQPIVVCSQWGVKNIKNILIRAEELGMKIKIVR